MPLHMLNLRNLRGERNIKSSLRKGDYICINIIKTYILQNLLKERCRKSLKSKKDRN